MNIKSFMDYNNYGGAVLLGCSKTIVKGHGSSKAAAVYNCVKQAYNMEKNNLCEAISEEITKLTVTENELIKTNNFISIMLDFDIQPKSSILIWFDIIYYSFSPVF